MQLGSSGPEGSVALAGTDSPSADRGPAGGARLRRATVIIADDDVEMRRFLQVTLQRLGYRTETAANGVALVDALSRRLAAGTEMPDVIVTDVCMPGLSGLRVVQSLRRNGCFVPVIVITALAGSNVAADAQRLNAMLLRKPFLERELAAAVGSMLGRLE